MNRRTIESGFTAVEMLVTIIVAALFAITFYQMFTVINSSIAGARQRSIADSLAYSYVKKYASPDIAVSSWFSCSTATGSSNTNDRTVNSDAAGSTIEQGSLTASASSLPAPVTYKVTALAIYGCGSTNANKPVRVQAEVIYGPRATRIVHGAYK